jgi:hypothetical protein
MMGRSSQDQGQLFYSFNLEAVVPDDHLVRGIAGVLDLSWVRAELAPHYSHTGRPSIDPVLMIRMLIVATYLPSARNAPYAARSSSISPIAGFVALVLTTIFPIIRHSHAPVTSASAKAIFFAVCSSVSLRHASRPASSAAKGLRSMQA